MTEAEKKALAQRLRDYAQEYDKISARAAAIGRMVADLRAAAAELMEGVTNV